MNIIKMLYFVYKKILEKLLVLSITNTGIKACIVIICMITVFSCTDATKNVTTNFNAPIPVNLYSTKPEKVIYYDKFPGTIVAMMQVDIRAEAEGYITGIFFKEGEHIKKGQKLYEIDNRIYSAAKNQAEANLRVAEANLEQAQKDADRYTYLNEHDAVAKQTLDHALTTLQNAKSVVAAVKQELSKTETDYNYTLIRAPFDGTIGISQVKTGNSVTKRQTILNTVSTDNPMAVDFVVNEKQIQRFIKLQAKKAEDSIFSIVLPDNSFYNRMGKILLMDRGVNPQTGTITIRLVFANDSALLKAGMSCMVRVKNLDTAEQIIIPSKGLVEQMGEYFVYVAKDTLIPIASQTNNSTKTEKQVSSLHAMQRKVVLGQTIGDKVIVKSGLQIGENVIVDGVQRIRDGAEITLLSGKPK